MNKLIPGKLYRLKNEYNNRWWVNYKANYLCLDLIDERRTQEGSVNILLYIGYDKSALIHNCTENCIELLCGTTTIRTFNHNIDRFKIEWELV